MQISQELKRNQYVYLVRSEKSVLEKQTGQRLQITSSHQQIDQPEK
jgi:hypothetical protein